MNGTGNADEVRPEERLGRSPGGWDENVIFVANLLDMFFGNEEQSQMLRQVVGRVESYGGRLLPVLDLVHRGPGRNLLLLERELEPALAEFFGGELGLSLPEVGILRHGEVRQPDSLADHPVLPRLAQARASVLDGYVTDARLEALASVVGKRTLSSLAGSRRGNDKWLLHQHLLELGLPVPPTIPARSRAEIAPALAALHADGWGAAVIKAALGASGVGIVRVTRLADCAGIESEVPNHLFLHGPCLVQAWLGSGSRSPRNLRSPSVQLFLDAGSVQLFDLTEQILEDGSIHQGNAAPPPWLAGGDDPRRAELLRQADLVGRWLHRQGYRGCASVDFLLADYPDGLFEVYACEINARWTGASYPAVLARHFQPEGAWLLRNLRLERALPGARVLELLRDSGDLYRQGCERGVLPLNFNLGEDGLVWKGQFLCLGPDLPGCLEQLRLARVDLPHRLDRD